MTEMIKVYQIRLTTNWTSGGDTQSFLSLDGAYYLLKKFRILKNTYQSVGLRKLFCLTLKVRKWLKLRVGR